MYTTTAVSIYQPVTKHAIVSVREKEHVAMAIPIRRRKATRIDRGERKKTANKFNRPKRALRKHGGDED